MNCKCGDSTCNCQIVCCCQRDFCSCDLCSVARKNSCCICGLPLDIEGQDVCQCFLQIAAPNLSDAPQILISPSHQVEPKVGDDSTVRKDTLASEENFNVSEQRRVKNEQHFLSLDPNPPIISSAEETSATKRTQNPGVLLQEVTGETSIKQCTTNIEGQTQEISDTCLQGNQNKNTTHSSKSCNVLQAFCASRNVTGDTTSVPGGATHSGLVTHTKYSREHAEGNSTKTKNYAVKRSEKTAGKPMNYAGQGQLNKTPNMPRKEKNSTLKKQQQETDQSRTFFSQKIPGLPFYRNEGFNFRIPCVRNWYAPKPFFNFPPTGFLDYSRFPQYSFPGTFKSTEYVTENSPTSEITPAEKHAYIQDWIERSNQNVRSGQEQGAACSSLGTELNSNIVTPGRKIKGRFPVSKKDKSKERFKKRSSANKELTSKGALFDDKTCKLKSNPDVVPGQEHSITSSSKTKKELSSHIVPVGSKIEGRFSVGKKCTSKERFGERSSANIEFRSRGKVDDENMTTLKLDEKMTSTLKLDEKNSTSIKKSENTRPEESRFSTEKEISSGDFPPLAAEINAKDSSCIDSPTIDYTQESSRAQCDSKEKQC